LGQLFGEVLFGKDQIQHSVPFNGTIECLYQSDNTNKIGVQDWVSKPSTL
jgi:hypothetical protein